MVKEGNAEGIKEPYLIRYMKGVGKFNIESRKDNNWGEMRVSMIIKPRRNVRKKTLKLFALVTWGKGRKGVMTRKRLGRNKRDNGKICISIISTYVNTTL